MAWSSRIMPVRAGRADIAAAQAEEEGRSAMIPGQFDYVRPGSLGETLQILKDREGEAKLLSGGYSLLPLIKLRLAQPALLVDLRDVGGLDGISETDDHVIIGAKATHRQIHESPVVARYPLLHDVSGTIGDPQVRNWGTIGGSVAHADPASDWPAVLLAASATIICTSQSGERAIPAREFFLDTFTTAIEPTEVLTQIRLGRRPKGAGGAYEKLERKVGDFATVGVAAVVFLGADGRIQRAGVALTGVAETPFAATDAGAVLAGNAPSDALFRHAGAAAAAQSRPEGDIRGPVEYKRAMAAELTLRALRTAVQRALANA
jgi:carbon-monoxide dehydrogenase medium subunit